MCRTFAKPREARQVEARARARNLGVKVAVVSEARRYVTASQSTPGTVYQIERTPIGWACSCEGYEHTGMCKHLGAVERRSEREGWTFGKVAPLAQVARYFPLTPQDLIIRGAVLVAAPATPAPALVDQDGHAPGRRHTRSRAIATDNAGNPSRAGERPQEGPIVTITDALAALVAELAENDIPHPLHESFTLATVAADLCRLA